MSSPDRCETERAFADLGVDRVVALLGIGGKKTRQAKGLIVCCPSHNERNPSCSVQMVNGKILFRCQACDFKGGVFDAVAAIQGLSLPGEFPRAIEAAASLVGVVGGSAPWVDTRPALAPEPEVPYPSPEVVGEIVRTCGLCEADQAVTTYLQTRRISAHEAGIRGLAWTLPVNAAKAIEERGNEAAAAVARSWVSRGHRIIVPAYNYMGELCSLRAWSWTDDIKRKAMSGKAAGLIMADAMGVELLRAGEWPSWSTCNEVVFCEGEPDFLTMACRTPILSSPKRAVFGVVLTTFSSGSFVPIARRIPAKARVRVMTHTDAKGEEYATKLAAALAYKCTVERVELS